MRVLISGGGTGGHIYPALAVARALSELSPGVELLYVGRSGGMEEEIVASAGLASRNLALRGIQPEIWKNLPLAATLPTAVARAASIIRGFKPDVVFGTGGYIVGAVGMAAVLTRTPLVLMVPDAYPGRAIRLLARRARVVCTAFEDTAGYLPGARVEQTGTPLREQFADLVRQLQRDWHPPANPDSIVVLGGSQGAHRVNTAVAEALKRLLEPPDRRIHHVSGAGDFEQLHAMRSALPAEQQGRYTVEKFNPDMPGVMGGADLIISRAGGSAIAEITALGKAAILVPYPFAGGHQELNAQPMAAAGAASVVPDQELSGVSLLQEIERLAWSPGPAPAGAPAPLVKMATASRRLGRPDAARDVARLVLEAAA